MVAGRTKFVSTGISLAQQIPGDSLYSGKSQEDNDRIFWTEVHTVFLN